MARMRFVVPSVVFLLFGLMSCVYAGATNVMSPCFDIERTIDQSNCCQFDATRLQSIDCEWAERLLAENHPPQSGLNWLPTLDLWKQFIADFEVPQSVDKPRMAGWPPLLQTVGHLDAKSWLALVEGYQHAIDQVSTGWGSFQLSFRNQLTDWCQSAEPLTFISRSWQSIVDWKSGQRFAELDLDSNTVLVFFPAAQPAAPVSTLTEQQAAVDYWEYYESCDYWGADFAAARETIVNSMALDHPAPAGSGLANEVQSHVMLPAAERVTPLPMLPLMMRVGTWAASELELNSWSQEDWFNVLVPIQTVQR